MSKITTENCKNYLVNYYEKKEINTQELNSYYNEVVSLKNKILGYFNNDDNKPKYRTKF